MTFQRWHVVCEKVAMLKHHADHHDSSADPAPSYASDAEIALAQRLRQALELRYFGRCGDELERAELPADVH